MSGLIPGIGGGRGASKYGLAPFIPGSETPLISQAATADGAIAAACSNFRIVNWAANSGLLRYTSSGTRKISPCGAVAGLNQAQTYACGASARSSRSQFCDGESPANAVRDSGGAESIGTADCGFDCMRYEPAWFLCQKVGVIISGRAPYCAAGRRPLL